MEDEKKKKKNKKKKNKQQVKSAAEDAASNAGNTSSREHDLLNQSLESTENKGEHNAETTNGARLRDMVKQLLYEKDSYMQREADLEVKIKQLQDENDSWHQKEVILEQRISQLLQEQASLNFEKRDLLEKVRHIENKKVLLAEKENSRKEMMAALDNENNRLRMQVVELEGAKDSISQQNRQLLCNISTLQSRMRDLETSLGSTQSSMDAQKDSPEKEDLNAQIETACALIEKLVTENAELVEKMNELYMELGSLKTGDVASVVIPDYATVQDSTSTSYDDISSSAANAAQHSEKFPIMEQHQHDADLDHANNIARHSSETTVSVEIFQIPLDENGAQKQDLEAQPPPSTNEAGQGQGKKEDDVPLTDAPLTGAPFRLISFVARYVSGSDLVNDEYSDSLL